MKVFNTFVEPSSSLVIVIGENRRVSLSSSRLSKVIMAKSSFRQKYPFHSSTLEQPRNLLEFSSTPEMI